MELVSLVAQVFGGVTDIVFALARKGGGGGHKDVCNANTKRLTSQSTSLRETFFVIH